MSVIVICVTDIFPNDMLTLTDFVYSFFNHLMGKFLNITDCVTFIAFKFLFWLKDVSYPNSIYSSFDFHINIFFKFLIHLKCVLLYNVM